MKKIPILLLICLLSSQAFATTYLSDHFGTGDNATLTASSQLTTEETGNWDSVEYSNGCTISLTSDAAYGSGRGIRFSFSTGNGTTQDSAIASHPSGQSVSYPLSVWTGFWFRMSKTTSGWNPPNDRLKMLRLYTGGNSIIPEWISGEWNWYYDSANHLTGYTIPDTDWHKYVVQIRGASTASGTDGIANLYVDGVLASENTSVTWGGSARNVITLSVIAMQGNLSGGYSGSAFTTDWDDYIIADTLEEVNAYLGSSPPVISGCTISGASMQ